VANKEPTPVFYLSTSSPAANVIKIIRMPKTIFIIHGIDKSNFSLINSRRKEEKSNSQAKIISPK